MKAYHVANPDSLGSILSNGLKCTSRGDKGDDDLIIKTDKFLDEHCPAVLKTKGISRDNNIYAYVVVNDTVVDITNGTTLSSQKFIKQNKTVLELDIDEMRCYVSDIDTYDAVKLAIKSHADNSRLSTLAKSYWEKLIQLKNYTSGDLRRPEIMITYDLDPRFIRTL